MNLNNIAGKLKYVDGPAFYQLYKFHRACSILYLSASEEQQNILSPRRFRDKCLNKHSPLSWARYVLMLTATRQTRYRLDKAPIGSFSSAAGSWTWAEIKLAIMDLHLTTQMQTPSSDLWTNSISGCTGSSCRKRPLCSEICSLSPTQDLTRTTTTTKMAFPWSGSQRAACHRRCSCTPYTPSRLCTHTPRRDEARTTVPWTH